MGLLYKNLGYIGADFDNTFVFVHSFGSGNPDYIQLYDKETVKNLIEDGSAWIDVDTTKQILLYSKVDVPSKSDSMTLFDTKKKIAKQYAFPKVRAGHWNIGCSLLTIICFGVTSFF